MPTPAQLAVVRDTNYRSSSVVVRLFLVRHGEAEANRAKITAGQTESPLTKAGIDQATALSKALKDATFRKLVASDMDRTQHTARLVLPSGNFQLEPRLREMAKGARESFPKAMSYDEALMVRTNERGEKDTDIPRLESNDDVAERVLDWLFEVLREAVAELHDTSQCGAGPKVQTIFAVTHAGVIRTLCARMVPNQMPKAVDISDMGCDGSTQEHLVVPNTSVTVIDFVIDTRNVKLFDRLDQTQNVQDIMDIQLKLLTWCDHLL